MKRQETDSKNLFFILKHIFYAQKTSCQHIRNCLAILMTKHVCSGPFLTWDSFQETLWIKTSDPWIPDFHSIFIIKDAILFKLEHETSEKKSVISAKIKLLPRKGTYTVVPIRSKTLRGCLKLYSVLSLMYTMFFPICTHLW